MTKLEQHEAAYQAARTRALSKFAGLSLAQLQLAQGLVKQNYAMTGPTHDAVAECEVVYEMIQERQKT